MNRHKRIIKISILGIFVNLILVTFKATVGFIAGSIAIILDAVNNLSDALAAIITIIGTAIANRRPNRKHPFGYGRIEYFSSIIIAFFILFAGLTAIKESISAIFNPVTPDYSVISLIIIAVAVVVKFVFGHYVKSVGRALDAGSLIATGTDAISDAFLSLATLVGALFNFFLQFNIECFLGIIIGLFILRSAIEILRDTLSDIIGERADPSLTTKIKRKILTFPKVLGVYDLALHNYGPSRIIGSVHIEVDDELAAKEIHTLTRSISAAIFENYGVILTVGIYAHNDTARAGKIKSELTKILQDYPEVLQLHGFYVDFSNKLISFDLIIDFKAKNPTTIAKSIKSKLQKLYPDYQISSILDADVSD